MHSKRGQALVCPAALALVDEPGLLLEAAEGELAVSHIAQGLEPVRKAGKVAVEGVDELLYALVVQLYYAVASSFEPSVSRRTPSISSGVESCIFLTPE